MTVSKVTAASTYRAMTPDASLYMDAFRAALAISVLFYHGSYSGFGGGYFERGDTGIDCVMAFFVLSGFVIAFVADTKEHTLGDYVTSRLARLWSVLLPALAFTFVADFVGISVDPRLYLAVGAADHVTLADYGTSALFFNHWWWMVYSPGANGVVWSISYEVAYYAAFAVAVYLRGWARGVALAAVLALIGPKILVLAPIWLLGVWLYRSVGRIEISSRTGTILFVAPAAIYILLRHAHVDVRIFSFTLETLGEPAYNSLGGSRHALWFAIVGGLVALHFLGFFAIQRQVGAGLAPFAGVIRVLSGCTLTIYLFHWPLLMLAATVLKPAAIDPITNIALMLFALAASIAIGLAIEPRRRELRALLVRACRAVAKQSASIGATDTLDWGPLTKPQRNSWL